MSPAQQLKAQMRGDLTGALKARQVDEISVLRALLAAIDNAEAPDIRSETARIHGASAEIERLLLTEAELEEVLLADLRERESAADELARVGQQERADALLRQAAIVRRYLG